MNECDKLSIEDLLRLVFFDGGGLFYSTCDSAAISLNDVFRSTILMGTDGLPVLKIRGGTVLCEHLYHQYRDRVLADGGVIADEVGAQDFICELVNS